MEIEIRTTRRKKVCRYQGELFMIVEDDSEQVYMLSLTDSGCISLCGKRGEMGLPGKILGYLKAIIIEDH